MSCGSRPSQPNVILVSVDTLRADALARFGAVRESSPNLDAFLDETCVFTQAYAPQPHTLPSHVSLLTSRHPLSHGVEGRLSGGRALAASIPTLATVLGDERYATAAFVNGGFLHPRFGLSRGFDTYDYFSDIAVNADNRSRWRGRDAAETNRALFDWIDTNASKPFFLFIHYFDVHSDWEALPYDSPESHKTELCGQVRERFGSETLTGSQFLSTANKERRALEASVLAEIRCLYDAGVSYLDEQFADLWMGLEARSLWADSLIVLVSDHGEEFQEHGRLLHTQLYEENVHVPLAVKLPENEGRGPFEIGAAVGIVDVMPTMLDLLGVPLPPGLQGVSHAQALRERGAVEDRPLFFVSADTGRFAVRDSGWKLIHDPLEGTNELYSLERDPYERRNVAAERPGRVEEISSKLEAWLDTLPRLYTATTAPAVTLDDETIRELKALGYVR